MFLKPVVNNNGHRPIADTDRLSPNSMPVSTAAGNQVTVATDGLYVGVLNETPVEIYVNSGGVDGPNNGTSAAPVRTLDYAIAQLNARDPSGRGLSRTGAVYHVMLAVNQAFTLNTSVEINGITLKFGFYGDSRGSWYTQVASSTLEVYEDVQRPTISNVAFTNSTTGLVETSRIYTKVNKWPCAVELHGVKLNIAEVGASNLGVVDFVDGPDLSITGSIINKTGLSAAGLMAIRADHTNTLRQFASQFQVINRLINSAQGQNGISGADLASRASFLKFYLGLGGGNYQWQRLILNPGSLNSSNASGMLTVLWEDSIRQSTGSSFSLASYPQMSELNFGIAQYITNLRRDQQGRAINVLGGRII